MIGNKMTLQYKVDKQVLERLDDNIVVEKSLNFLYVKFIFSDEWRGLTKYALFNYIDIDSPYKLEVNKDGIVKVPYDLITFPGFLITLQGVNKGGVRITTETRMVDVQLLGTIDADEKAVKYVTSDNNTININKNNDELDLGIETQFEYTPDTHTLDLYAITHNEKDDEGEPIEVETLLSSVVLDSSMIEKTYTELATMKDNGELIAGQQYRIIDYVTKVNDFINSVEGLARSMEHPFDIIVTAISNNKFSENARAVLHNGDTYFANCDLSAWQLWYCFANDSTRFEFADTVNGKGVIYRMIDEFDNDIPYDFKNIQFKRFKITGTTDTRQEGLIGKYLGFNGSYAVTFDTNDFKWYYTLTDDTQEESNDLSILSVYDHNYTNCRYAKQVLIGEYLADEPNYRYRQALNDIVLASPSIIVDIKMREGSTKNTIVGSDDLTYNYFGAMCRRNIMYGEITHNKSDECMESNTIGNGTRTFEAFHWNRVGRHFHQNIVISATSNSFATSSVQNNVFPTLMEGCSFTGLFLENNLGGMASAYEIKFNKVTRTTIVSEGGWTFDDILALESCNINIHKLIGSKIDFLQQLTITRDEGHKLNVVGLDIHTIIGSPSTINLSDLIPYKVSGSRGYKVLECASTSEGSANHFKFTCSYMEGNTPTLLGAYSEDGGTTWVALEQSTGGSTNYVVTELPTENIDTNGNYFVMTESENARGYLSTDISNLTTTEYPPTNPGTQRNTATVNSVDYVKLNTATVSSGDYMGDLAIKFNIPCDVTVTVNPRQTRLAFMYIDVNGTNVKLVSAGETESYTRTFNKDETLCVRGASFSTNDFYYKLEIQPYTIDGKIPLSTNVDEYINFENLWFKNNGGSSGGGSEVHLYMHRISGNQGESFIVYTTDSTPFTTATIKTFLTKCGQIKIAGAYYPANIKYFWDSLLVVGSSLSTTKTGFYNNNNVWTEYTTYSFTLLSDTVTEV